MWCMRWQRLSVFETLASGSWALAGRRLVPSIAVALCLMVGGVLVLAPALLPAEAEELIEGGDVDDDRSRRRQRHARHQPAREVDPRRAPAGIRDDLRRRMQTASRRSCRCCRCRATGRAGEMRTTAGSMDGPHKGRAADAAGFGAADSNATTCVAGCGGRPGAGAAAHARTCRRWPNRRRAARRKPATSRSISAAERRLTRSACARRRRWRPCRPCRS